MLIEQLAGWMDAAPGTARREAAVSLVQILEESIADPEELEAAEAALTCLLDDPDIKIRQTLAEELSRLESPPRYLILALAGDEPEISIPVLARSGVLLDGELITHVRNGTEKQQIAIACRAELSSRLCAVIADEASRQGCLAAILNPGARLLPEHFFSIATRFGDDPDIRSCLLARHDIGMAARILLIEEYAISLAEVDEEEADEAAVERRKAHLREISDKAIISFAAHVSDAEVGEVVRALIDAEKLTTSFLLRAICMGNIALFAHALSLLSEQPVERVSKVLMEERQNAFHAIYARADMPVEAMEVFRLTISAWKQALPDTDEDNHACLPYLVTRQVLATYEGVHDAETDELLLLLRKICTETARDNARHKIARLSIARQRAAALPAPEEDWDQEELMMFACYLADELAELTLADEAEMSEIAENLVPANEAGPDSEFEQEIDHICDALDRELEKTVDEMRPSIRRVSLLNRAA